MPINFSEQVYEHAFNTFARPVIFTPLKSAVGSPAYEARGIYGTQPIDIMAEDNSIISDQQTILDIRDDEFTVVPVQGDHLSIPAVMGIPAAGDFEVLDTKANGGGETTLAIRKLMVSKP